MIQNFYDHIEASFQQPPAARIKIFHDMHARIVQDYLAAIRRIDAARAEQACADGRTLKQVVGHIGEWDRYLLLAAGEILAGVTNPQIMQDRGFLLPDGSELRYAGVDDFNAQIAARQAAAPWSAIQRTAILSAELLERVFTHVMPAELLDATAPYHWQIIDDRNVDTTAGWFLWGILLEHEGPGHAQELGL
jgi:hypothetical protein